MPRRTLLATAGATGLAALSACTAPSPPRRRDPVADPTPGLPISTSRPALMMQILAHPDDDLYFMNPDTQQALDAGTPLVCVYLTGGEATGINRVPGRPVPAPDKAAYSSSRHQGLRQAYATLLGLGRFAPWRKSVIELHGGHRAEIDTLTNRGRRVELIFVNTAMHTTYGRLGLPSLWQDRRLVLPTVVADGSPLRKAGSYTYDGLIDVLAELFERYRPSILHTMDPDPDIQHSSEAVRRRDSEQQGYSDHPDHTAAALFTWASLIRWVARTIQDGGQVPSFATTAFRAYYNRHWPKNLPPAVLAEKASHLVPYGGSADWRCGNPAGCGDYNVGGDRPLTNRKGWVRSTHYRYPGPRPAVAAEPDGRLVAYEVLGLRAVRRCESAPGSGVWDAPDDLGGGPLAPVLGSATLPDGRHLLFGLRFSALGGHGADNEREIVALEQRSPGGPFRAWQGLGNPERGPDDGRRIGVPVAVAAPDGRVHLFVRNAEKGISTRVRDTAGRWGGWQDTGGGEIQDGLSAVVDSEGCVHVYAAGRFAVHHWTQDAPGEALTARTQISGVPVPGDGPAALPGTDGTVELFYRAAAKAALTTVRTGETADETGIDGYGRPIGGRAGLDGYGPVAAAGSPGAPVLLGRTSSGLLQLRTPRGHFIRRRGPVALDGPALHVGKDGRPTVVATGPDALPWIWRP
ncbi:PIG-L family deacetylase [Streptomyces sp. NBC_00893]|uniref:PIG-L family deacetylase n=1 Tax=Streptomyces sp. NBC_00893 TaxID=2975862 RepID=UPI0022524B3D|nr:PIG-L family deacetylase [Streptomyces sp. NBC_00893]MCX4845973.1 PIG-L family deacetylase [Streptomyces sp. NBC_00893]